MIKLNLRNRIFIFGICMLMGLSVVPADAKTVREIVSEVKKRSQKEALEYLREYINGVFMQDMLTIMAEGNILQTAMVQNSENAEIAYAMGYYLSRANKMPEAVAILEKVRDRNPKMLHVRRTLAYCYMELGETQKAIDLYEQVIKEEDDQYDPAWRWRTYFNLGNLYEQKGEYQKSLDALNIALEFSDQNPSIYKSIAIAYLDLKEWDKAIEFATKAIAIQDDPSYRRLLGEALEGIGKSDLAIEEYRKAILLDPSFTVAWIMLANYYLNKTDMAKAEETYRHVLMLDPQNEYAYTGLGVVYYQEWKYSESVQAFSKALQINPKNTFVLERINNAKSMLVSQDMAPSQHHTIIRKNNPYTGRSSGNTQRELVP